MGTPAPDSTFDYIVIGAGSAGCVLANRLSANPGTSVCVIEAGGRGALARACNILRAD